MTADYTIEATPGQIAAIERDGFLVVVGPRTECKNGLHAYTEEPVREYHCPACDRPPYRSKDGDWYCFDPKGESDCRWRGPNPDLRWCCAPVPTTKPCPECGGRGKGYPFVPYIPTMGAVCPTCNGDGTVPIVVEVVVPERRCPCMDLPSGYGMDTGPDLDGSPYECPDCYMGTIPARTILRGTVDAVPVVEHVGRAVAPRCLILSAMHLAEPDPDRPGMWLGHDITDHFSDVPRPEVGDTAWIIRGEGS